MKHVMLKTFVDDALSTLVIVINYTADKLTDLKKLKICQSYKNGYPMNNCLLIAKFK